MIITHPDQKSRRVRRDRPTRPTAASIKQPFDLALNTSMPLLNAIAAELYRAGDGDELTSFRTARQLLE